MDPTARIDPRRCLVSSDCLDTYGQMSDVSKNCFFPFSVRLACFCASGFGDFRNERVRGSLVGTCQRDCALTMLTFFSCHASLKKVKKLCNDLLRCIRAAEASETFALASEEAAEAEAVLSAFFSLCQDLERACQARTPSRT